MNNYPLIRFVLFFICGLLLQVLFQIDHSLLLYLSLILCALSILVIFLFGERLIVPKNILIILTIICVSAFYFSVFSNPKTVYPFEKPNYKNTVIFGKIGKVELIKIDRLTMLISADSIYLSEEAKYKNKINLLYTIKDSKRKLIKIYDEIGIGNSVVIIGNLTKPRDQRNPGEYDYQAYLSEKQIVGIVNSYSVNDFTIADFSKNDFANTIFIIRKKIDELISNVHNKTTSGLLRGLLLADRSLIDYETRQEFVNSGVVHILAVSGLHVGFIVLIFLFLFQRYNIYVRYMFTITGLILLMVITDSPPSVIRATIMSISLLLSPITGRSYNSYNALALAAFLILLINPNELFNPGFQLSFSAVLSIVIFYPPLSKYIESMKIKSKTINYILLFSVTSLAAQIGTLPFTLVYFEKLSFVALLTNIFVIPLVGCIVGLGIFTIFVSAILPQVAIQFALSNELLTYILFNFVSFVGHNSYSYLPIYNFSLYDTFVFYFIIGFLLVVWKKIENLYAKLLTVTLSIILLFVLIRVDNYDLLPDDKLSIMSIDVGQGDSFLIKFPGGKTALIDAGDALINFDNGNRIILPLLNRLGIDKIDYGFVSHIDSDHYRGFLSLIEGNKISLIYKPKIDSSLERDINFEKYLKQKELPFSYYSKEIISIGNTRLYILNDTTDKYYEKFSSNDKSGILKLVYGNTSFLFTGDAGIKAERYFVDKYSKFLKSNLLKAGHHGSKTSTSNLFLDEVQPDIIIISVGVVNKFKHPHQEVINKLNERNISIYRTDESGAILFQSDGKNIKNIDWKKL